MTDMSDKELEFWTWYSEHTVLNDGYLLLYRYKGDIWRAGATTSHREFAMVDDVPDGYPAHDRATIQVEDGRATHIWINGNDISERLLELN